MVKYSKKVKRRRHHDTKNIHARSPSFLQKTSELSIRRQCELMHIQRSKVYYKPAERSVDEQLRQESIMARIDHWHTQMPGIGTRKLVRQLKNEGFSVGRKLVRRLMGEMGIQAIYPKANLSKRNFRETIVPYLLRNKAVSLPNQVWSIDITYIKMQHSHMYLTAIIDWYSRMIVGWNLSDTLDTGYVIQAVKDAVAAHGTPAILNSDQGCQFTSNAYKTLLRELRIRQSMDGKSRWADNVMIERWFRSLKTEEIYLNEYPTPRALRKAISVYIQQYNTVHLHQTLEWASSLSLFIGSRTSPIKSTRSIPVFWLCTTTISTFSARSKNNSTRQGLQARCVRRSCGLSSSGSSFNSSMRMALPPNQT